MSGAVVLDAIPFTFNEDQFFRQIHIDKKSKRAKNIYTILEQSLKFVFPRAVYCRSEVEIVDQSVFIIGGKAFKSIKVRETLNGVEAVYPNIVSCGEEIEDYCRSRDKMLDQYITTELCNYACQYARGAMLSDMRKRYGITHPFDIFPGEDDWEMLQGIQIFKIFEKETPKLHLKISDLGTPSPSRTAYGLVIDAV